MVSDGSSTLDWPESQARSIIGVHISRLDYWPRLISAVAAVFLVSLSTTFAGHLTTPAVHSGLNAKRHLSMERCPFATHVTFPSSALLFNMPVPVFHQPASPSGGILSDLLCADEFTIFASFSPQRFLPSGNLVEV